jgi:hypothetical protein
MSEPANDKLSVHVNVEISAVALQAIVANAKRTAPRDSDGNYRVDTADCVSAIISRFLAVRDFDSFVMDVDNYS